VNIAESLPLHHLKDFLQARKKIPAAKRALGNLKGSWNLYSVKLEFKDFRKPENLIYGN
jgi:hypothetical protein